VAALVAELLQTDGMGQAQGATLMVLEAEVVHLGRELINGREQQVMRMAELE